MADELYRSLQNVIGFLESFTDDVLPKISSHGSSTITCEANELLVGAAAGAVCFPTTIGVVELFLFAPLLLSSRIRFLSSFLGMIPVSIASCTSAWTFLQATAVTKYLLEERLYSHSHRSKQGQRFRVTLSCRMEDFVFYGVIGLCAFKIFRGRFRSVLPSHLFSPGAFSCEAVTASSSNYASIVKKSKVDLIGMLEHSTAFIYLFLYTFGIQTGIYNSLAFFMSSIVTKSYNVVLLMDFLQIYNHCN